MRISSKLHGIIDYAVVAFLLASPTLFGLPPLTATFTYVLAAVHLTLTLGTRFELGLVKVIPLTVHGYVELAVSVVLVGVAFYLGAQEGDLARNFYLVFAAAVFATWLLSDYKTAPAV